MRVEVPGDGLAVRAYAGTTGVLVAANVSEARREGLLGFALERLNFFDNEKKWLPGLLAFPGTAHAPGQPIPSNVAPFQKFRWSDYGVYPDSEYEYTVSPVYSQSGPAADEPGVRVRVRTESTSTGEHSVLFNRAAAASQAFSRKFPEVEAEIDQARRENRDVRLPEKALDWLSRGVREQIVGFIEQAADSTWGLDIGIYEYELDVIVKAVDDAIARGVDVRIVYHARRGDPQTAENEHNLSRVPPERKRARLTSKIFHDKFIVASRIVGGRREPEAVLAGSTNFTPNGVYRQGNVVHVVRNPDVAAKYLAQFESLFRGDTPRQTKKAINDAGPVDVAGPLYVGFSPRSGFGDLTAFEELIDGAERDVLFCTAFDLYDPIEQALLGKPNDDILRLGLENSRSTITGVHRDRTARFSATAMLSRGLEGFLKESTRGQRGNILIHTKLVVVDFTSEAPTVISGSHNLSSSASGGNDENFLIVRGNTDVADCYGVELMRLYDHYRFRWSRKPPKRASGAPPGPLKPPPVLDTTDAWTDRYFRPGSLESLDRRRFGPDV